MKGYGGRKPNGPSRLSHAPEARGVKKEKKKEGNDMFKFLGAAVAATALLAATAADAQKKYGQGVTDTEIS